MAHRQSADKIRQLAQDFDNAVASKNRELALTYFADDCEIELLGVKLTGKEGTRRWFDWLYQHLAEVSFLPVTIMVDGNIFFEEFVVTAKLPNGISLQPKQAEVLIYENYKIKNLRLYFDRLDFADAVLTGFLGKKIVQTLIKKSLKGLV